MFGRWCASQVSTRRICDARTESAAGWCASVQPISIGSRATVWPRYSGDQVKFKYNTLAVANLVPEERHLLLQLKSIGPAISALLSREVYYRQFTNRRQVGSFLGLAPSPYNSGAEE